MIPEFASNWELGSTTKVTPEQQRMRKILIDGQEYYMLADSLRTRDSADVPSLPVQVGDNQGYKISDYVWPNPSTVDMTLVIYDDYRDEYITHLKNIYKNKTPVTVVTPWEVFPSAILKELSIQAKKKAINVLVADVTFQEIRTSKVSVEKVQSPQTEEFTEATVEIPLTGKLQLTPARPKFKWTELDRNLVDPDSPLYVKDFFSQLQETFTGHHYDTAEFSELISQGIELREYTFTAQRIRTPQQFLLQSEGKLYTIDFRYTSWDFWYWITHGFNTEDAKLQYAFVDIIKDNTTIFKATCDIGTVYRIKDENGYLIGLFKRTGLQEFKIWLPP